METRLSYRTTLVGSSPAELMQLCTDMVKYKKKNGPLEKKNRIDNNQMPVCAVIFLGN